MADGILFKLFLRERLLNRSAPGPVEAFKRHGTDFVVANDLESLVGKMNALTDEPLLDPNAIRHQIEARDLQMANPFAKDAQVQGIRNARRYLGDRIGRVAAPHRILDPAAGPLIGVKLHILTRKTLGGIQTDLSSRAFGNDGQPIPGLYAVGEAAGFGGGGVHGTTPWKAPSSVAASSPGARPDVPQPKPFSHKAAASARPVSFDATTSR